MKKIKKKYFALVTMDDSESSGSVVRIISIDTTEKNLLKDLTNKLLLDFKIRLAISNWIGTKFLNYTIEKFEKSEDYWIKATFEDEDGITDYDFCLEEVELI